VTAGRDQRLEAVGVDGVCPGAQLVAVMMGAER
jgi:hypothetical protein